MELKPINVIIGPQASGKSVTAKLLYFFKSLLEEIYESILNEESRRELDNKQAEKFSMYFPKDSWPNNNFKVEYHFKQYWILVQNKGRKTISFTYSESIRTIIDKSRKYYKQVKLDIEKQERLPLNIIRASSYAFYKYYFEDLKSQLPDGFMREQLFIPAGRSFFSQIQSNIFNLLNSNYSFDPFLTEFGAYYENLRTYGFYKDDENDEAQASLNLLFAEILNGKYLRDKGKDYLVHKDFRRVNLMNASSGQQEILPLLLILRAILKDITKQVGTLYIEEPEAHLFPIAQKRIVQLLTRTFNARNKEFQTIITTHSPYILASFNNLMEAGKVLEEKADSTQELAKIISKDEIIPPHAVAAYSLFDGEKTDLIDPSTHLISQNILDSVSDEISIEFGKLLDLEF